MPSGRCEPASRWSRRLAGLSPSADVRLQARVGIATGLAVVGDLIGEGAAREEAVVGDVPNLAARLQALAAPGTVVIAPATRRLIGGLFDLADLGTASDQGLRRAGASMASGTREQGAQSFRGAARWPPDAPYRPGARARRAGPRARADCCRPRPDRGGRRRSRRGQVAADRRVSALRRLARMARVELRLPPSWRRHALVAGGRAHQGLLRHRRSRRPAAGRR